MPGKVSQTPTIVSSCRGVSLWLDKLSQQNLWDGIDDRALHCDCAGLVAPASRRQFLNPRRGAILPAGRRRYQTRTIMLVGSSVLYFSP